MDAPTDGFDPNEMSDTAQLVGSIMEQLDASGQREMPKRDIAAECEESSDNVGKAIRDHLQPRGLVELADKVDEGFPTPTNYYALTPRGRDVDYDADRYAQADLDDLRETVRERDETIRTLRERVDELEQSHEQQKDKINEIAETVNGLYAEIN